MKREILADEALQTALAGLQDWQIKDRMLNKRFSFNNFADSLTFVNRVGELAEAADHHPDITFGWGYAEVSLMTHDRGGITDVDIDLAAKIGAI